MGNVGPEAEFVRKGVGRGFLFGVPVALALWIAPIAAVHFIG